MSSNNPALSKVEQDTRISSADNPTKTSVHELRDDELNAVTGGLVVNAIIAILIGMLPPPGATGCGCN